MYSLFNIQKSNSICFGDSGNDISMFESSGIKVAMKNATEDIKNIADYITEHSNNENGVIEFLKKYLIDAWNRENISIFKYIKVWFL